MANAIQHPATQTWRMYRNEKTLCPSCNRDLQKSFSTSHLHVRSLVGLLNLVAGCRLESEIGNDHEKKDWNSWFVAILEATEKRSAMSKLMLLSLLLVLANVLAFAPTSRQGVLLGQSSRTTIATATTQLHMFDFLKPKEPEEPEPETVPEETTASGSDDPIDKIFSFFFGEKEENPMGMKRFGQERFPEQYPAVVDEWADPVASDSADMAILRPMLKNTNLEERGLKLTYSANRDGWTADKFHKKVDKLGGGLVVCTTTDGLVCGGYNPKGWVGYGEARGSIAAFLFVFDNGAGGLPTKLKKVGGPSFAQQDLPEIGPSFGADSLVIPMDQNNPKIARSKLGSYYERFSDGTSTLFGERGSSVKLKDLKVYHGVYAPDEYIPFTDAEPFALY